MTRRFIAGAVCPQCRALDRLVVEVVREKDEVTGTQQQRCVECGYRAERRGSENAGIGIPRGKPERRSNAAQDAAAQAVKIMDLQPISEPRDEEN